MKTRNVSTVAPVFPDDGPRGKRIIRRLRAIPLEILAFVLVTVLLPVLLVVAAVVDLALWLRSRKPWVGVRLVAFLWWFLLGEVQALVMIVWIWLRVGGPFGGDSEGRRVRLYNLRVYWARHHLRGISALFGLRWEIEGLEHAGPGPVIVMLRHASIIDNTLPDSLVSHEHGIGLRYVIKRELQSIPTIDIGGRWVPTTFLRRTSSDPETELARMRELAVDLHEGEGILIYPEGTRHTDAKLARVKEKLAESGSEVAPMAARLQHVLPPRLGGPLGLLEASPETDVVFFGHVGFDGYERISDIWSGELVGQRIAVHFWRCPAAEIPEGREERIRWLYDNWQRMDDWIGERRKPTPAD